MPPRKPKKRLVFISAEPPTTQDLSWWRERYNILILQIGSTELPDIAYLGTGNELSEGDAEAILVLFEPYDENTILAVRGTGRIFTQIYELAKLLGYDLEVLK